MHFSACAKISKTVARTVTLPYVQATRAPESEQAWVPPSGAGSVRAWARPWGAASAAAWSGPASDLGSAAWMLQYNDVFALFGFKNKCITVLTRTYSR